MTSKYGSFSPKNVGIFCCCQNPFSAILKVRSREGGKALVAGSLKNTFCGFPKLCNAF